MRATGGRGGEALEAEATLRLMDARANAAAGVAEAYTLLSLLALGLARERRPEVPFASGLARGGLLHEPGLARLIMQLTKHPGCCMG